MAALALRGGSLSRSGALAAIVIGGMATAAGYGWALLLVAWFVASSLLTRMGREAKQGRSRGVLAASEARRAVQVWANGAVFAGAALSGTLLADARGAWLAAGALAAAAADTWATEIGLLWGGTPRLLLGGGAVEPGRSGGVTAAGFAGSLAGAFAVAGLAGALRILPEAGLAGVLVVAAAGFSGGLLDSALGQVLQASRRCVACGRMTERQVHDCGAATEHHRGLTWMTNDTVNLLATAAGALGALGASRLLS